MRILQLPGRYIQRMPPPFALRHDQSRECCILADLWRVGCCTESSTRKAHCCVQWQVQDANDLLPRVDWRICDTCPDEREPACPSRQSAAHISQMLWGQVCMYSVCVLSLFSTSCAFGCSFPWLASACSLVPVQLVSAGHGRHALQ